MFSFISLYPVSTLKFFLFYFWWYSYFLISKFVSVHHIYFWFIHSFTVVSTEETILKNGCLDSGSVNGSEVNSFEALDTPIPDPLESSSPEADDGNVSASGVPQDTGQEDMSPLSTDHRSDSVSSNPPHTPTSITRVPSQVCVLVTCCLICFLTITSIRFHKNFREVYGYISPLMISDFVLVWVFLFPLIQSCLICKIFAIRNNTMKVRTVCIVMWRWVEYHSEVIVILDFQVKVRWLSFS